MKSWIKISILILIFFCFTATPLLAMGIIGGGGHGGGLGVWSGCGWLRVVSAGVSGVTGNDEGRGSRVGIRGLEVTCRQMSDRWGLKAGVPERLGGGVAQDGEHTGDDLVVTGGAAGVGHSAPLVGAEGACVSGVGAAPGTRADLADSVHRQVLGHRRLHQGQPSSLNSRCAYTRPGARLSG